MGYRSDVVALIYPDETIDKTEEDNQAAYDQLKVLMNTTFKNVMDDWASCIQWLDKDRVMKSAIEDVKGYGTYPEVQRFEATRETFCDYGNTDEIEGYCVEFIRVGEDIDDVEDRHKGDNNQYYLYVRRSIDCNV
jgi:hypothetical protein